jgi:uncharacterized protein
MLAQECRECKWMGFCYGGCLKHRLTIKGAPSELTFFCESYKMLFEHSKAVLDALSSEDQGVTSNE